MKELPPVLLVVFCVMSRKVFTSGTCEILNPNKQKANMLIYFFGFSYLARFQILNFIEFYRNIQNIFAIIRHNHVIHALFMGSQNFRTFFGIDIAFCGQHIFIVFPKIIEHVCLLYR